MIRKTTSQHGDLQPIKRRIIHVQVTTTNGANVIRNV